VAARRDKGLCPAEALGHGLRLARRNYRSSSPERNGSLGALAGEITTPPGWSSITPN
jgi:hypothetical protein